MKKQFQVIIGDDLGCGIGAEDLRANRVDGMELIDAKEKVFGVRVDLGTGKGFRGEADGE